MQSKPIRRRRPHASAITPDTPIWCPACQDEHSASAFNVESRRYSGLSGICREAQRRVRKTEEGKAATARRGKRRWADPAYRMQSAYWRRERVARRGANYDLKRSRERLQAIVRDWKKRGCVDCGYDDIRAIDPDHLVGEAKSGHVSRLVQLCASADRIRTELDKCVPSLRALPPARDARAATFRCARGEALAAFLAAALRDAGPERCDQARERLWRLRLGGVGPRARLGSRSRYQVHHHRANDRERTSLVRDRGRDGQVRVHLRQLPSDPDCRT